MSMPNAVLPWSHDPAACSAPVIAPDGPDVATIAAALFRAGFADSAFALAEANPHDDTLNELAAQWRTTRGADAALASMIERGAGAIVPSVPVRADGSPRFVLQVLDTDAALAAIETEHGEHGVDSELRLFLDEALRDGDRFVDASPGVGFAALSAASGDTAASVIVLCADEAQRDAIETSARLSDVDAAITARVTDSLDEVPTGPAIAGGTTMIHVGGAAAVAPLLSELRGALERGEIGAVAWRCGRADEQGRDAEALQVAAAVLGLFGFRHFALAQGADGIELVPAETMASNTMIFSLEPGFLARFAA
ncbi:MAG TPA: hypothetical protein VE861_16765 [Gemmatimonadaceae bacterium]|nr:hypothetical protein [Gemmatimonadaceae bacterium]